ncbi:MAG: single-stranded DNA-binding protein [Erysipelotrichaceae bacterium]
MINRVVLIGRLTKDPMLKKTATGKSVVSFTMAVNKSFQSAGSEQKADFINCVAWNKTADFMGQYLAKGALISLEGRINTRTYDDQSGKRVYVTEVVADDVQGLEPKGTNTRSASTQSTQFTQSNEFSNTDTSTNSNQFSDDNSFADDTFDIASDDLPF